MKKVSTSRSRNLQCTRAIDFYAIYAKTREFHLGEALSFYMNSLSGVIGKFLLFYAEVFSKFISVFFDSQYMVDFPSFFKILEVIFYDLIEIKVCSRSGG